MKLEIIAFENSVEFLSHDDEPKMHAPSESRPFYGKLNEVFIKLLEEIEK